MLDRIHQTAKAVHEKTGATISIQLYAGEMNGLDMQIYPAGWGDAHNRVENCTASPEDWSISRSVKHYSHLPASSEGQAEIMEILEALL